MRFIPILFALLLVGCAASPIQPRYVENEPDYAPVIQQALQPPPQANGAIWQDSATVGMFSDQTARRPGDIITVLLQENTRGSKSASAASSKSSEVGITSPNLFGSPVSVLGNDLSATVNGERSFNGSGSADQSNSLTGSISVTINEVYANGVLSVRGEKWITLNDGSELVRVSGLVRPEDIDANNQISSQKMADARITYSGTGSLATASQQGWLMSFFNSSYWPF